MNSVDINSLAAAVAQKLNFQLEIRDVDYGTACAYIRDASGRRIFLDARTKDAKLEISGCCAEGTVHGDYKYGEHLPTICVSIARGAEAIAKEIQRRLLPTYDVMVEAACKSAQVTKTYEEAKKALGKKIAGIFNTTPNHNHSCYVDGIEVRISSDTSVRFNMELEADEAEELARFLASRMQFKKTQ